MDPNQPVTPEQQPSAPEGIPPQAPSPMSAPPVQPVGPQKTNGLAIAGLVFAFLIPIIGLILSIVALTQIKKHQQRGQGLAIAGIAISAVWMIVSAAFLAMVLSTFTGVQQRARDTERQTDINAIHSLLENYYAQQGKYPTLAELNDASWRTANAMTVDTEAFKDPAGTSTNLANEPQLQTAYGYEPFPTGCDNVKTVCGSYTVGVYMENAGQLYTKESLN